MADDQNSAVSSDSALGALPLVKVPAIKTIPDLVTILGLGFAIGLIILAISMGNSNASFFNVPSLSIVVFGTVAVTAISYSADELLRAGNIINKSVAQKIYNHQAIAKTMLDIAIIAKKKGLLFLSSLDKELEKDPFLQSSLQMAIDGGKPDDINHVLSQRIAASIDRHKRTASMTKRASEIAPAMGLIGTLVGLVQMLADLENPETIGPAMAVALLTTFYGAIMGTVVMAPLSVKLDKNSQDEALARTLIRLGVISIARQDNPRKLEAELNAALPPHHQIQYFD